MLALFIKSCVTVSNYWKFDESRIPAKVWTLQWISGRSRPKKHADSTQRAVSLQQIFYRQQKPAKKRNASHSRWEEIGAKHVEHLIQWIHFLFNLFRENGWLQSFCCERGHFDAWTGQLDPSFGLLSFGRGDAWSWWAPHQLWHLGCSAAELADMMNEVMTISSWNDFNSQLIYNLNLGLNLILKFFMTWIFLALPLRTTKCRVEEIFQFHGCNDAHSFLEVSNMSAQGLQHIQRKETENVTPLMDEIIFHLECWILIFIWTWHNEARPCDFFGSQRVEVRLDVELLPCESPTAPILGSKASGEPVAWAFQCPSGWDVLKLYKDCKIYRHTYCTSPVVFLY